LVTGFPQQPRIRTVSATYGQGTGPRQLPTIRLHDLRHFYTSGLIFAGCDVVTDEHHRSMGR